MTGFVQIIEYRTKEPEAVAALMEDFRKTREAEGDGPAPVRSITCADRDDPGRYFSVIEFASYDEAMENSQRADTTDFSAKMMALCDGPGTFYNLDLVDTIEYR